MACRILAASTYSDSVTPCTALNVRDSFDTLTLACTASSRTLSGSRKLSARRAATRSAIARSRGRISLGTRSEEHTSELQSLMRISYAVFCLKKKTYTKQNQLQN